MCTSSGSFLNLLVAVPRKLNNILCTPPLIRSEPIDGAFFKLLPSPWKHRTICARDHHTLSSHLPSSASSPESERNDPVHFAVTRSSARRCCRLTYGRRLSKLTESLNLACRGLYSVFLFSPRSSAVARPIIIRRLTLTEENYRCPLQPACTLHFIHAVARTLSSISA